MKKIKNITALLEIIFLYVISGIETDNLLKIPVLAITGLLVGVAIFIILAIIDSRGTTTIKGPGT